MNAPVTAAESTRSDSIAAIEARLQAEKQRIADEIHRYPPPIPACDAQFNYLLERRDRISQELGQLHAITSDQRTAEEQGVLLRQFLIVSTSLSSQTKDLLLTSL